MLGFVNEVKEAVQEYKPQLDIENMALQNSIEIPTVKYDHTPSHFSPTTRNKNRMVDEEIFQNKSEKKDASFKGARR